MVSVKKSLLIACLPVAGQGNPYQQLMMEGLNQSEELLAVNGVHDKFFGIARTLVKYRPSYIHFDWIISYYYRRWGWFTYLSVLTFCAQIVFARLLGVKLVWTLHNILPHDTTMLPVHRFCQRFLARRCEWVRVFAHSSVAKAAEELKIPEEKFCVVPEGSYTEVYPNVISREEARQRLKIPSQTRVFLYIGLIKPYKGILELIRAFNQLGREDSTLIIAGKIMDNGYGDQIRKELTSRVVLHDRFVPAPELQYYFNAADVVVLPFRRIENSGSVIMAMGFRKPIICPAEGVLKERLLYQTDWLYNSPQELEATLRKVLDASPEALNTTGITNFKALSSYRWEDFTAAFA